MKSWFKHKLTVPALALLVMLGLWFIAAPVQAQYDIQYIEIYAIPMKAKLADTVYIKDIRKRCSLHTKVIRDDQFEALSSEIRKLKPSGEKTTDIRVYFKVKFFKGEKKDFYLTKNKMIVNRKGEAAERNPALVTLLFGLLPEDYK